MSEWLSETTSRDPCYASVLTIHFRREMLERLNFNEAIIAPTLSSSIWMLLFFVPFMTPYLLQRHLSLRLQVGHQRQQPADLVAPLGLLARLESCLLHLRQQESVDRPRRPVPANDGRLGRSWM